MRILVVEDDESVAAALTAILANQNYAIEVATDGQAGLELADTFDYDLILLDVMLPKLDGISLCRRLRSQGYHMPILLLTGRDSGHDKAVGLDAGADDYVVKPFDPEELVARIRALLRRASSIAQPILEWGNLRLDPSSCEVTYENKLLSLTPKEYALLELFLRNNHRVFSCGAILEHLWTYEDTPGEEAVRTHIKGLRQKLKAAGAAPNLIETVYGIGYRLKPLAAEAVSSSTPAHEFESAMAEIQAPTRQQTLALVAGIWDRAKESASAQVAVLEQAAASLSQQAFSQEQLDQARHAAHTLAGSLGIFGFAQGSQLARQIEGLLQTSSCLQPDEVTQIDELATALRREIQYPPPLTAIDSVADARPLLLVIDSERTLAEQIIHEAAVWGFRGSIAHNLRSARNQLYRHPPHVVLLDPALSATEDGLKLLAELHDRQPPVPVVVFTAQFSLSDRLEVVRLGGRAFVQKPAAPEQVLQAVRQVYQRAQAAAVLVVDDDPTTLAMLKTLLKPWGINVTTLDDPQKFWETLEDCSPDLLILDIEMPGWSGIELCQVVRNDVRWSGVPVLFLTDHTEPAVLNQVFAAGADDFVSKPIIEPELVTRILNRLERVRLLRRMAEVDPLTQVSNRHKSSQDLNELLRLAGQHNQPLCLAVLDLDQFKQINDRYGHAVGDRSLSQIGQLLRQAFRSGDVVARWGGEEFVIGLYGTTKEEGAKRLNRLLTTLHRKLFAAPDGSSFQVTFSAGVAQHPEDGVDLQSLHKAADAALYQAKQAGCDRILTSHIKQELSLK